MLAFLSKVLPGCHLPSTLDPVSSYIVWWRSCVHWRLRKGKRNNSTCLIASKLQQQWAFNPSTGGGSWPLYDHRHPWRKLLSLINLRPEFRVQKSIQGLCYYLLVWTSWWRCFFNLYFSLFSPLLEALSLLFRYDAHTSVYIVPPCCQRSKRHQSLNRF